MLLLVQEMPAVRLPVKEIYNRVFQKIKKFSCFIILNVIVHSCKEIKTTNNFELFIKSKVPKKKNNTKKYQSTPISCLGQVNLRLLVKFGKYSVVQNSIDFLNYFTGFSYIKKKACQRGPYTECAV